jgi:hypothetical protein
MDQQPEQQPRRGEALDGLVTLAIEDVQFRRGAVEDLEGTLWRYGFALTPREMEEVREYHSSVAGMTDQQILEDLESGPEGR